LRFDGATWAWREGDMSAELGLFAFYVTFRAAGRVVTVCVDARGGY
jgi:hypothetical protein